VIHFVPQRQVFPLESILERPDLGFALLELTIKAGSLELSFHFTVVQNKFLTA
jgi:hypothetical protein